MSQLVLHLPDSLHKRAARGNTQEALAILDRVPNVPPMPSDEMPH